MIGAAAQALSYLAQLGSSGGVDVHVQSGNYDFNRRSTEHVAQTFDLRFEDPFHHVALGHRHIVEPLLHFGQLLLQRVRIHPAPAQVREALP